MKTRSYRTELGPKFSEGARRTWLLLDERGWKLADVLEQLERASGRRPSGSFSRWMYGDQWPSSVWARHLEGVTGVPAALFGEPSRAPFTPPAARKAA